MNEHQCENYLNIAFRAADQEWHAVNQVAHRPSPEGLDAACRRARNAALAALAEAGLDGEEALALAERAARQQDDESEVPVSYAEHDASRYPAQVSSITWHLLDDGYTVTWTSTATATTSPCPKPSPGSATAGRSPSP